MKITLIISLLLLLNGFGYAQGNGNINYFVTFYAYAAELLDDQTPGHVIIAFGKEDGNLNMSVSEGAWGFYPKATTKKIANLFFDGVVQTGVVRSDTDKIIQKQLVEARISKSVSEAEYRNAYKLIDQWKNNEDYHIATHNCVHFGQAIAKAINMNVPSEVDMTFPDTFLKELVRLNK